MTEFSSAELDRLLTDARATLEEMRADRPTTAPGDGAAAGEATAGGGRVTATAEHGRLTSVEFDEKARALPSADLAALVVTAVNTALDALRPVPAPPSDADAPQNLNQVEQLTQAINDALGRIG